MGRCDPTGIGGALAGFGDQRNYELFIEAGFAPRRRFRYDRERRENSGRRQSLARSSPGSWPTWWSCAAT